jgi:hypothetical protein
MGGVGPIAAGDVDALPHPAALAVDLDAAISDAGSVFGRPATAGGRSPLGSV